MYTTAENPAVQVTLGKPMKNNKKLAPKIISLIYKPGHSLHADITVQF